ncbi:MAG: homoserine kinase [Actinomycetota bacterium]|jgi:homoserine kinase
MVRVPASSANLGPGFDVLGLALSLWFDAGVGTPPPDASAPDDGHPAAVAYAHAGGTGPLWVRTRIPAGRGLGFSGAARVAGLAAAHVARGGPSALLAARDEIHRAAAALEGHPDNVGASLLGGATASTADAVTALPLAMPGRIVVWYPRTTTSTRASRGALPERVALADAVVNVAGTAVLVAALAAGDPAGLAAVGHDRLHQDARLSRVPESRAAMEAMVAAGAWGAWLSGSGPTVACWCDGARADDVAARVRATGPADATTLVLDVDRRGARVEPATTSL